MTLHRVVTTVLLHQQKTFLITLRSSSLSVWPNYWTIPGGGLELEDYKDLPKNYAHPQWYNVLELSARRELYEEVGLETESLSLITDLVFLQPNGIPVIVFSYMAPYIGGKIKLNEENVDYAWVTLDQAKGYPLIPGIFDEIKIADFKLK